MKSKSEELKTLVKDKYSEIAQNSAKGCCGDGVNSIMSESYENLKGYTPDADLELGCGIPIEHAGLKEGQHVLDLGSGAGNDLFVARSIVGDSGHLTGLDFSDEMNQKAEENRKKLGYSNMEFLSGDIEQMPLEDDRFDVVLSNCVLNLVPDKHTAFSEIYRVLKPGGHFTISDVVVEGTFSAEAKRSAELYAGCVTGAIDKSEYLDIIRSLGFKEVAVQNEREIEIPEDVLPESAKSSLGDARVLSITVTAVK